MGVVHTMIYVRGDILTKELKTVNLPRDTESILVEVNLLNQKW